MLIAMREKELDRLKDQLERMKQLVLTITAEWKVVIPPSLPLEVERGRATSWSDRSPRFDQMRSQLLEAAENLARTRNEPLHQTEIIEEARRSYTYLKGIGEDTLTARIREMCEPMGLLNRVSPGYYFPSKKAVQLGTGTIY